MDESSTWLNLDPSGPTYFYRVTQHVIAFNSDNEVVDSYNHIEDFKDSNLLTARNAAIDYLEKRYVKLPDGFIYPYVSPSEWKPGKEQAMYSHNVALIEFYDDDEFEEYILTGEDEEENRVGLEHEAEVWLSLGLGKPPYIKPFI